MDTETTNETSRPERCGPTAVAGKVTRLEIGIVGGTAVVEDVCGRRIRVDTRDETVMSALGSRFGRWVVAAGHGRWAGNGKLIGLRADVVWDCPPNAAVAELVQVVAAPEATPEG